MKALLALASAALLALAGAAGSATGATAAACNSSGAVDVLPLHSPIAVHHDVKLVLLPDFELNRLVPGSISFHVLTPTGKLDLQGGDASFGATFKAPAVGGYTAGASWTLHNCDDPSLTETFSSAPIRFKIVHERPAIVRFKSSVLPGHASRSAPIFAVDYKCSAVPIQSGDKLTLTVWWELGGKRLPTHSSPSSSLVLPKGCHGKKTAVRPTTKSYRWGVARGSSIGVLPGNTVRVLGELRSGKKIVAATRVRFVPRGTRETIVRDQGRCVGGCVRQLYRY